MPMESGSPVASATQVSARATWWAAALLGALLLGAAIFNATAWKLRTDLAAFVGDGSDPQGAAIARAFAGGTSARTMIFTATAPNFEQAGAALDELAAALTDEPEVARVLRGPPPGAETLISEQYFARRWIFGVDGPGEVAGLLSEEGIARAARRLKQDLTGPAGALVKRIATQDPWQLHRRHLRRIAANGGRLDAQDGRFVAHDGEQRHAVLFVTTHHSPFAGGHQGPLHDRIESLVTAQEAAGVRIERASVHRFAVASERAVKDDANRVGIASIGGVMLLFAWVFGSVRMWAWSMLPVLAGVTFGTAAVLLWRGSVHGLTLGFGATLVGVCIDYPVHLFVHRRAGAPASRGVWAGIALGAGTTMAGFIALALTGIPGLQELGLFASVGVGAAALATRLWLARANVGTSARVGRWGAELPRRATKVRIPLAVVVLVLLAISAVGALRLRWVDDARGFNELQPEWLEEDARVRARVGEQPQSRRIVCEGADETWALRCQDRVVALLHGAGVGARSVHPWMRAVETQAEIARAWSADASWPERMRRALEREGFSSEAFADLHAESTGPLRLREVTGSAGEAWLEPWRLSSDPARWLVVTDDEVSLDLQERVAKVQGARWFDTQRFMTRAYRTHRERVVQALWIGLAAVFVLLAWRYRSLAGSLRAVAPAVLGGAAAVGIVSFSGAELHVFHLIGAIIVLSMGVDYGVFLAESPRDRGSTSVAVVVAWLSTMLGFGLLGLSSHPAMAALGLTVGVGVSVSAAVALALFAGWPDREEATS